ncbi:MAG TPA: fibronectin type III domain-containing protein [Fervidobacterium sp.]|nr:fibronectin type III domain-containing protein [Fervidobacterium sp.]HPT54173.1 fibronectin type III domain-containing protein [Fervidobacterium sp.]HPZ17476.1 fibronectin type III domain-containing protein [Fervidobacterium sp.]HQE48543.1 fibronectin type III domain-containing protein [Fervidobacterium sp.]HUM42318.1 fibronectin type III domain-containing protein [Fervidobacterium sp.]
MDLLFSYFSSIDFFAACTPVKLNPPQKPTDLTATAVSSSEIQLEWKDNSMDETGFKIERKLHSSGSWKEIAQPSANTTTYKDTNLDSNTTYDYRIRAYNNYGDSDYSNVASATTSAAIPQAPTNLAATALSSTQIKLAWQDNSTNETGFKIERKTGSGTWTETAEASANATTYTETGLDSDTTYYYRIRAYNDYGDSDYSNVASATTSVAIPQAPTNLAATVLSSTQIKLTWQDNSTNETGFKIERKTGSSGSWNVVKQLSFNTTEYTDEGLTPETTYCYRVVTYNDAGNSPSDEVQVMTLLAAPANLTAKSISYYEIELSWEDRSNIEAGYIVERQTSGTTEWEEIETLGANVTTYTDGTVTKGQTYKYRVAAYKDEGKYYSNEASATVQQAWEMRYGEKDVDDRAYCVAQTDDGGYLVAGTTQTSSNNSDLYIMKIDSAGNKIWEKIYTTSKEGTPLTNDEVPSAMQRTLDGNYIIAGYTKSFGLGDAEFYVVKIDENGEKLWEKVYSGYGDDYAYDIQQTADGGYVVVGKEYYVRCGLRITKLDRDGNIQVDEYVGVLDRIELSYDFQAGYSVKQTPDGGYLIAGEAYNSGSDSRIYIFKSGQKLERQGEIFRNGDTPSVANSLDLTNDGGFVIAGQGKDRNGTNEETVYVVKYKYSNGGYQEDWVFTDGGAQHTDVAWSIKQTTDGGYIVAGDRKYDTLNISDVMVYKLNASGGLEGGWTMQYGATDYSESGRAVLQTSDGGYIVVGYGGYFHNGVDYGDQFYVLKLDSKGYRGY